MALHVCEIQQYVGGPNDEDGTGTRGPGKKRSYLRDVRPANVC